jgi:hypothetical protein
MSLSPFNNHVAVLQLPFGRVWIPSMTVPLSYPAITTVDKKL